MRRIVLASGSPARRELLERLNIDFEVVPSNYEEDHGLDLEPRELVKALSLEKAREVANRVDNSLVIGADLMIFLDKTLLGKPHTKERAREMLRMLSGKCHLILTGISVIDSDTDREVSRCVETRVYFRELSDDDIENYVNLEEPLNCAGAYKIQSLGHILVSKVEGDFSAIIGLPLLELIKILKEFNYEV
jgi:septum formation protein